MSTQIICVPTKRGFSHLHPTPGKGKLHAFSMIASATAAEETGVSEQELQGPLIRFGLHVSPTAVRYGSLISIVIEHIARPNVAAMFRRRFIGSGLQPFIRTTGCNPLRLYHGALIMVVQVVGAIAMIVRVYALYERSRYILAMLVFLAVGANAVGFWVVSSIPSSASVVVPAPAQEPLIGCPDSGFLSPDQSLYLAVAWGGQLLFDVVVFGLTFWRSVPSILREFRSESSSACANKAGRVMSAANIGNITALLVASDNVKDVTPGFTNVGLISSAITSECLCLDTGVTWHRDDDDRAVSVAWWLASKSRTKRCIPGVTVTLHAKRRTRYEWDYNFS
ncbi:hypothetical protein EDD16DRAFT_1514736 [Pisolithus croceorrhizus]|nr:hypothetical protein EDD16DRAFT_1514736 [Pisolithus croceorrhizus]